MKIYTKTGDDGTTGTLRGDRVLKSDPLMDLLGDIDEFNAALGMIHADIPLKAKVQSALFDLGAELAADPGDDRFLAQGIGALTTAMEKEIDLLTGELAALTNFILPGGTTGAASAHLARTICRRAERKLVALGETRPIRNELRTFLNRLSDWLFTWARMLNHQAGVADILWTKER